MATQTATQRAAAAEKALAEFRCRVVEQIKHYQDDGTLCDTEYNNIREALDLHDLLPGKGSIRVEWAYGELVVEGTPGVGAAIDNDKVVQGIAHALGKILEEGIKIEYRKYNPSKGTYDTFTPIVKYKGDLNNYEWEDDN